ncbi:hypothetical protein HPP92_002781 [Vanilla planifolia]|uniref:Uncharacterized protein n=1 Tax=Vanilla planifolia TaxID=51239 RepID=A0A835S6Y5_VANPL|nr:hypothetical protein HPP92_002781 [Vanilla planifolia]
MEPAFDLPCDGDGLCMACKTKTPEQEATLAAVAEMAMSDCSLPYSALPFDSLAPARCEDLVAYPRDRGRPVALTETEKAKKEAGADEWCRCEGRGNEEEEHG